MNYEILLTKHEIKKLVVKTAEEIVTYIQFHNIAELTLMPIMNGSIFYAIDLMRQMTEEMNDRNISCNLQIETLRIKSYENNSNVGTTLTCDNINSMNIEGRNILIVDDVFDTGNTLKWLVNELTSEGANMILTAVFVDKTCNHTPQHIPNFVSYTLNENKFLVGYGMDDNGLYREWTDLCYII